MSIEALKQKARRHEQNEEWLKALDQYQKAINAMAQDDQTDIGLINRVGDLYVRVGKLDDAVAHYEQAVDLYREAFLPNNAIAVCKKVIRNVPERHQAYLKIGQIRAEQGFLPDARTNFLTYAERMQQAGDLDESFRALVEFCDLAPDDHDVRITVADQMAANQRTEEAVEQLLVAHARLTHSGEHDLAQGVEKKIGELDSSVDIAAATASMDFGDASDDEFDLYGEVDLDRAPDEPDGEFAASGDFEISGTDEPEGVSGALADAAAELVSDFTAEAEAVEEADEVELPMMDIGGEDDEEEAVELPTMGFAEDDEEETVELPTIGFAEDDEEEAVELPTMAFDEDDEEEAVELPTMAFDEDEDTPVIEQPLFGDADDTEHAVGAAEASEALAEAVEEAAADLEPVAPSPAEPPAVEATPEAESDEEGAGYVDLGAMILGASDTREKSTRFKVAYEEPSGDEEADFAKMLSQFKEKVSENLDSGDVRAHYDLGTAYKEMGLLEEAISSFQQALRASANHLPTYEQMGQTFLEMGQPDAAVRTLERALQSGFSVEDELLGIYYYLARAFEALDDKDSAVEYYDRVFALDINFADVTERLRELR